NIYKLHQKRVPLSAQAVQGLWEQALLRHLPSTRIIFL
ncbi:hypothetical protein RRG08_066589, partial [Elysia crispata]